MLGKMLRYEELQPETMFAGIFLMPDDKYHLYLGSVADAAYYRDKYAEGARIIRLDCISERKLEKKRVSIIDVSKV